MEAWLSVLFTTGILIIDSIMVFICFTKILELPGSHKLVRSYQKKNQKEVSKGKGLAYTIIIIVIIIINLLIFLI